VTAQRLESLGLDLVEHDFDVQPARILISEGTRAQLDSSFDTERIGEFNLKGKNEPVTVHRVRGRATSGVPIEPDDLGEQSS
jgi:class 3 adenylate cyclase